MRTASGSEPVGAEMARWGAKGAERNRPAAMSRRRFLGAATVGVGGLGTLHARPAAALREVAAATASPAPALQTATAGAAPMPLPVPVPQLRNVPVSVYGHSWTVPMPWHSTGNHWTERLPAASGSGALTNLGYGGLHMESTAQVIDANPAGSYGTWDWGQPATKTLALVMNVYNSAAAQAASTLEQSVRSFELAARHVAATILSGKVHATPTRGRMDYGTGWRQWADPMSSSGNWSYADARGAVATWTPAASAPMAWVVGVTYNVDANIFLACDLEVRVGGELRYAGPASTRERDPKGSSASEAVDYMKTSIPIGPVAAGVPVTITKTSSAGRMLLDGCQLLDGRHHVALVKEHPALRSTRYPEYTEERIVAHNAVLDGIQAEFEGFAPGAVSLVDLAAHEDFDAASMLWTGDTLHPNDKGQAWLLARLTQELAARVPWTPRLHTM